MELLPEPFEPCPPASPAFSLRLHLIAKGVPENDLSSAMQHAHDMITTIPGLDLKRYNPRQPIRDVYEG